MSVGRSTVGGAATGASIGSTIPGIGTAIGAGIGAVVGAVGSIFKKKHYVLWMWNGTEWQAVMEGHAKAVKKSEKEYKAGGYKTVIKKAGITPAPLPVQKSDTAVSVWWFVAGGGAVILYLLFGRKRR